MWAHIYDNAPPPRELRLAWHVPRYGEFWLSMPAGDDLRINTAQAVYNAVTGYKRAEKKIDWIKANPELYDTYKKVTKLVNDGE